LYGEKLHSYGVTVKTGRAPALLAPLSPAYEFNDKYLAYNLVY